MQKYRLIRKIGQGAFGDVYLAEDTESMQSVAVKIIKRRTSNLQQCLRLREVQALLQLNHPNIMRLQGLAHHDRQLWIVCEFARGSLYEEFIQTGRPTAEPTIRRIIRELASALHYLHKNNMMHRDLKPENVLCCGPERTVKLCDFGLAKNLTEAPPHTTYVSTRWYRAPELILRMTDYGSPVDVFALGCIMAELFNGKALFPGQSQKDQLVRVLRTMGTPSEEDWPELYSHTVKIPKFTGGGLKKLVPTASNEALNLLQKMLKVNPKHRITAKKYHTANAEY